MGRLEQVGGDMRTMALLLVTGMLLIRSAAAQEDPDPRFRGLIAPAVASFSLSADGKPDRKDFDFGRNVGKAWLASKGEVKIDTWVQHRGLRCARYEVGIRFGEGDHGCTNVRWLAPVHWLTSINQCNNALMQHAAVDTDEHMVDFFDQVTCAERIVRCEGNCK
ncbi:MAG: hypothetical protein IPK20_11465 [Betaproteobacteria bacterium]|nr:hypothetical protein [Betaproteobacteria bacterium]